MSKKILGVSQHSLLTAILGGAMASDLWIGFQRMDRGRPFFDEDDKARDFKYAAVHQAIECLGRDDAKSLIAVLQEHESNIFDEDELPISKVSSDAFLKVLLDVREQSYLIASLAEEVLKAYEYLQGSSFAEIDFNLYSRLALFNPHAIARLSELIPIAASNLQQSESNVDQK